MRVFHGMTELANQAAYSIRGLQERGIYAKSGTRTHNPYALPADFDLKIERSKKFLYPWYFMKTLFFALFAMIKFDVFHFHAGYTLIPGNKDLRLIKLLRKNYFLEYHGDELRHGEQWSVGNPYAHLVPGYADNDDLEEEAKKLLMSSSGAIVHDREIALFLPESIKQVYYVPLRLDVARFEPSYPAIDARKPLVVHAPTNRLIKGSAFVEQAVTVLKKEFDFTFVLVENMSQQEAHKLYQQADIIMDQFIIGSYGVFALEGMALGKPVMTYIRDDIIDDFPSELPIVNTTPDTIEDKLRMLLQNPEMRYELGIAGRKYVENYHDYRKISQLLSRIYETNDGPGDSKTAFQMIKNIGPL